MVCIIDDREDVWTYAQNLVHVKPYIFFKNTGDINDPHGVFKAAKKDDPDPEVNGPERRLERRQSIDMPSIEDQEEKKVEKDAAAEGMRRGRSRKSGEEKKKRKK